ncbi:hypothetical protein GALMADRAFT_231282 [Galerina marginata CBS 339.88]|uniref:Uncharacterized protein n=1 Tax=Galerina marginata (strain CBS 339.88) TaxID=685588 RepID=A0A067SLQ6_GALM3|nr:hypothetical protein GALMADRAFT_231282 [Galerina marginata CBS 339.88]
MTQIIELSPVPSGSEDEQIENYSPVRESGVLAKICFIPSTYNDRSNLREAVLLCIAMYGATPSVGLSSADPKYIILELFVAAVTPVFAVEDGSGKKNKDRAVGSRDHRRSDSIRHRRRRRWFGCRRVPLGDSTESLIWSAMADIAWDTLLKERRTVRFKALFVS